MTNFEETSQLPQIGGVVDGLHIPIFAPGENKEDYFNRKHAYSVNLVGVVDINMLFLHASVGHLGNIQDSRVRRCQIFIRKWNTKIYYLHPLEN